MIRNDYLYTRNHVWVKPGAPLLVIGATEPLVRKLRPLVAVELPDPDDELKYELPFGELEGRELTYQLYPPLEGSIIEVNDELIWNHTKLEKDPYGDGWLLKVQPHEPDELRRLFASALYRKFCEDDLGEEPANG